MTMVIPFTFCIETSSASCINIINPISSRIQQTSTCIKHVNMNKIINCVQAIKQPDSASLKSNKRGCIFTCLWANRWQPRIDSGNGFTTRSLISWNGRSMVAWSTIYKQDRAGLEPHRSRSRLCPTWMNVYLLVCPALSYPQTLMLKPA